MSLLTGPIRHALAAGATVITPNRRLARRLVALHDGEQQATGRMAWPAARALPWEAWLQELWRDAMAADAGSATLRLRTASQAAHAWSRIVSAHSAHFIDPRGAAAIAGDAWALAHEWGAGGESWRAWSGDDAADDCATFARWASRYARELTDGDAVDPAQLADRLCVSAGAIPSLRGSMLVLAGFSEFSPQQERLLATVATAGAAVAREDTLPATIGHIARASGTTPGDEIARALTWARSIASANSGAAIAIAVEDLAARRDEIRAAADEILCPALQWPGAEGAARPYNISLGAPLSEVPLVAAALDLLEWADGPLPLGRAAVLIRSPWVTVGDDAWMQRARLESDWLLLGRRAIPMREAVAALREVDQPMAERWAAAESQIPNPASGSPRQHAEAWRARLAALGWPGERTLGATEHQARGAWDEALAAFGALAMVEARMSRRDALAALRAHVGAAIFQAETPPAAIQIVGVLEAAGQPFDALWVAGLSAERWPPAPRPNPLLPIHWQRERGVPRASAAREYAYATGLTEQFARAAPIVVFSHPLTDDDHPCMPSLLLPEGVAIDGAVLAVPVATAVTQFDVRAPPERIADDNAPPLTAGCNLRGGAGLIDAQSACPFKAVAAYRLRTETWPGPIDGLSPMERGLLVHAALAAFWREVGTQARLLTLSEEALATAVRAAVATALDRNAGALPRKRWSSVTPLVSAGEGARIEMLLRNWVERHERQRPAFAVHEIESELPLALGDLTLRLRVDRIDRLHDGGAVIVDYKTGSVETPSKWFEARPQSPQLGLYAIAHGAAHPDEAVRAVAYARLKPGDLAVCGLAADAEAWPPLPLPSSIKDAELADWRAVEGRWSTVLQGIAAEISAGAAAVSPRDRKKTCAHCGRQPLCRIGAPTVDDRAPDRDE